MSEEAQITSTPTMVDAEATLMNFKDFNTVELCQKQYCVETSKKPDLESLLEQFKLGIALGHDQKSCQSTCASLKNNKNLTKSEGRECDKICFDTYVNKKSLDLSKLYGSIDYNQAHSSQKEISNKPEVIACKEQCTTNTEILKIAAEEYYKKKQEEMAKEVSDSDFEKKKESLMSLIDKTYNQSIKEANSQHQESKSHAEVRKNEQQEKLTSFKKEMLVENRNVNAEEMKRGLFDKVKEAMTPEYKFLNLLTNKDYIIDKVCKKDYCAQEEEKHSQCNSECNDSKFLGFTDDEYQKCKTNCQEEKEREKQKCQKKCDTKQKDINDAAEKYCQKIKIEMPQKEFDAIKMEEELLYKVKTIMKESDSTENVKNVDTMGEEVYTSEYAFAY